MFNMLIVKFKTSYTLLIFFSLLFTIIVSGIITSNLPIYLNFLFVLLVLQQYLKITKTYALLSHKNSIIRVTYKENIITLFYKNATISNLILFNVYKNSFFVILYLKFSNKNQLKDSKPICSKNMSFLIFKLTTSNQDFRKLSSLNY